MTTGREIRLRIRGIQYPPQVMADGEATQTQASQQGLAAEPVITVQEVTASYFFRAGAHYLLYEEKPEGFEQTFKTRVKRRGRHLEIDRQSPVGGSMVFEPGKTWRTEYATPFGRLPLDIVTEAVEVMQEESSVESAETGMSDDDAGNWQNVRLKYTLMNQGESLGEYELYIERI